MVKKVVNVYKIVRLMKVFFDKFKLVCFDLFVLFLRLLF